MKYLKNDKGLAFIYTLVIIVFLSFFINFSLNRFFHLQFMSENEHNVARIEYFVILSIDYLERLFAENEAIDAGLFSISGKDVQFQFYKNLEKQIYWHVNFSVDSNQYLILLKMDKETKKIVSWVQLE